MPVDNNEHQKIDDVSTDLRYTVTRGKMVSHCDA